MSGIQVPGKFRKTSDTDEYAIVDANDVAGGWQSMETIALRNAIPLFRRKFGMVVDIYLDPTEANNFPWKLCTPEEGGVDYNLMNNGNWINIAQAAAPLVTVTPTGALDGVNVTFTLPTIPVGTLLLFLNGGYLVEGVDFTLSGLTITMTSAPVTDPTPLLRAVY